MSTPKQILTSGVYWIAVGLALASFVLVLTCNTELVWPVEHRSLPLSWALGAASVLAFVIAEVSSPGTAEGDENPSAALAPALETLDF